MALERIIFFDLETTSLHRVGQILNFCFICVDKNWKELGSIKGEIQISRLELPDPMAIISTGIDVIEQNKRATLSETQAMKAIDQFLNTWNKASVTALSGFNSEDFDIPYLRTSFLRSGVYPYAHPPSLDVMLLARYCLSQQTNLREKYHQYLITSTGSEKPKFSVRLEHLAHFFKLLDRPQAHESEDDVRVTIALAKKFEQEFNTSIFSFEPYQLYQQHNAPKGTPHALVRPAKSFSAPTSETVAVLLRVEGKASYWVELEAFQKWKKLSLDEQKTKMPIRRLKFVEEVIWANDDYVPNASEITAAKEAYTSLSGFSVNELYPPKTCCIEQWMYRLEFPKMKELLEAFKEPKSAPYQTFNDDQRFLWNRYFLSNMSDQALTSRWSIFVEYCQHRYGENNSKGMRLYENDDWQKGKEDPVTHPSLSALEKKIEFAKQKINGDPQFEIKMHALNQLKIFYDTSAVKRALNSE